MVMVTVAPHVGAWIEILSSSLWWLAEIVAPHVGAWIEIRSGKAKGNHQGVAPHVGAWIEIDLTEGNEPEAASHPTWVRGLKLI